MMDRNEKKNQNGSAGQNILWTIVFMAIIALVSYYSVTHGFVKEGKGGESDQPAATPEVSIIEAQIQTVTLTSQYPGRTSAFLVAEVRPQVSGIILKRHFTEGSEVKAGQALYEIDPAPLKAEVDNAEANLIAMRKKADQAKAALAVSTAGVERQKASLKLAQTNRERYENLFKEKSVTAIQRDQAVTEAEVAEATLRSVEAEVKSNQEAIGYAEAAIKQAEAALNAARINLGYTKITAPITGRIGKSNVTQGAMATAYQATALATIQQIDPIYVDVPQSTTELLRLRRLLEGGELNQDGTAHQQIQLLLEDETLYTNEGILQFRDITVDPTTGSFILRIVFPNPDGVLLPGMFVRTIIKEGTDDHAILIPQQSVSRDPKGNPNVLIIDAENKIQQHAITLDRAIGDTWLVSSGLAPGDRIVIEGMQKVRPGDSVKIVPSANKPKEKTESKTEESKIEEPTSSETTSNPQPATKAN